MGKEIIDLLGQRFGRYTVLAFAGRKNGHALWNCICDCGAVKDVCGRHLRSGGTTSCGNCLKTGQFARGWKHGMCGTKLYNVWRSMINRCTNPKHDSYARYGGRGISVCRRWMKSENFFKDMGESYKAGLTIDREDSNGNYEPSNCRWLTPLGQARNRSNNVRIQYKGEIKTISEWAEVFGINRKLVEKRIRAGWDIEDALTLKPNEKKENKLVQKILFLRGVNPTPVDRPTNRLRLNRDAKRI